MTTVVMLSPGYPQEMAWFTRGLAAVGATVIGVGDQPRDAVPRPAREALAHYEHVSLADEQAVLAPHGGHVVEWLVEDGDLVAPGQPLVRLHPEAVPA